MGSLSGNKIKDTYSSILKLETNGATSSLKTIEDGAGVDTALKISTTEVQVDALSFATAPTTDGSELTGLFIDGTNNVVKRELDPNAFAPHVIQEFANPMFVLRTETAGFPIEVGLSTPSAVAVNNNSNNSSHEVNDTQGHFQGSPVTSGAVQVIRNGLVKIDVNLMIEITGGGNPNIQVIVFEKPNGGSASIIQTVDRAHTNGQDVAIGFSLVRHVLDSTDLYYEVSSSVAATLINTSTFILTKLD